MTAGSEKKIQVLLAPLESCKSAVRYISSSFLTGLGRQQSGLVIVILLLVVILTALAGSHIDRTTGKTVNNFFNSYTLMQTATDASFFAVMAVGATMVIISGGIDLSVGSIYALCGVLTAAMLRYLNADSALAVILGIFASLGLGIICGLLNGLMVVGLEVHPFIITPGTMWIFRGIAFAISKAENILVPGALTAFAKANLGQSCSLSCCDAGNDSCYRGRSFLSFQNRYGQTYLRCRREVRNGILSVHKAELGAFT